MNLTIETAPQHYGRVDGDRDATDDRPQDSASAFNRRAAVSRLHESERAEYAEAYNEAYELECQLQVAAAEVVQ